MIAYVTMQYPSPSETFAMNDVLALEKLGHSTSVHSLRFANKRSAELIKVNHLDESTIFPLTLTRFIYGLLLCLINPSLFIFTLKNTSYTLKELAIIPSVFSCWAAIKKRNPSLVHLFWGHYPSLVGLLLKRSNPEIKLSLFLGAYDLELGLKATKEMIKVSDHLFTHSKSNTEAIEKLGAKPEAITVIHRGADIEKLKQLKLEYRRVEQTDLRLLSVGRLVKDKGFKQSIDVLKNLKQQNIKASLVIVGDGPFRSELESYAAKNGVASAVTFTGYLSFDEVLKEYLKADFFLLLSFALGERLPNVVKEAMALGAIPITSYTPGIEELVTHEKDGFLFDYNDISRITEAIIKHSQDWQKMEAMRKEAFQKIEEKFDNVKSMQAYAAAWGLK